MIFDYLNSIFLKTSIEFDSKQCPKVLLMYWLSQDKSLISYVNKINPYLWYMSDYQVYKYFYDIIPKKRRWLGKWTKGKKQKLSDAEKLQIREYKAKYNLSDHEINELLELE